MFGQNGAMVLCELLTNLTIGNFFIISYRSTVRTKCDAMQQAVPG